MHLTHSNQKSIFISNMGENEFVYELQEIISFLILLVKMITNQELNFDLKLVISYN